MDLTWTVPAALWLLLAIPLVWLANPLARTTFNPRQRLLQTAVRSLLLALLVLALARPIVSTSSTRQSIVYLVDVSHSIAGHALEHAAARIDEMNGSLRPAHSRIVAFGRSAAVVEDTEALRRFARMEPDSSEGDAIDRSGTDLETALLAARAELVPEHVPRLVLFSDGHQTAGDAMPAIARLAAERVPISTEPLAVRAIPGDAWVVSLEVPERVAAGGAFGATVHVASPREAAAVVELRSGERTLAAREVTLASGVTPVTLEAVVATPGAHLLLAVLTVPGDPLAANDTIAGETWADPPAKVLYVEGAPASAKYLSGALARSGLDVTVRAPSALPSTAADFDPWDVVILSDIARAAMPEGAMEAVSDWVEAGGGGLLVAGGEAVFGEDGYRHTPLERITPVTFERRDEPEVALVIVLDRSWSMAGASMELTKVAAQAAVDVLSDEQSVGILTFNDKFDWDVPLRNVGKHRDEIRARIAAIAPGGHTLIFPAVEQAYFALRNARARARHVILLSDGRSYPGEYEALVTRMVEARITVSTVAVGPSADLELLRDLARWGKGRGYVVADASEVAAVFVKEAQNAMTPAFDERAITPMVKAPGFLAGVDLARMPILKGRTTTVLKETALELVATDEGDPLLAFWPVGLGRTAVFASDVKDRWAANWVTWPGYGPFFTSVVRALQRQRPPAVSLDLGAGPVRGSARTVRIGVEVREPRGAYGNLSNPTVQVQPRHGDAVAVATRQVAPGRYEAAIVADATQPLTVSVAGAEAGGGGITSRTLSPDPALEYRFSAPDERLLESIASATGGAWRPTPSTLAGTAGDSRPRRRPLWPALLALALVSWSADLALRRVRVFEPRTEA